MGSNNDEWGIGAVIRDENSVVAAAASWRITALPISDMVEASTSKYGLEFALEDFLTSMLNPTPYTSMLFGYIFRSVLLIVFDLFTKK